MGHIERFNPVIKRCKGMIDDGELGEVITISSRRVSNFPGRIRDVGVILDLGIHDIDNSIFLMGSKPVSVFCTGGTHNDIEYEDHVTIMILFENGKSAVIEVNWITPLKVRKISLTCEKAFAELDYMDQTISVSSSKYIDPPNTTDFAIMFLPIEGLYAEVLKEPGLLESLRDKYKITITGPTTFSALLNSLQMGFRTLAVQKRSSEVWKILEAVKTEFNKFGQQLEKVDKQLNTASKSLNDLRLTRTNAINRKMRDVITIDEPEAEKILDIKIDN